MRKLTTLDEVGLLQEREPYIGFLTIERREVVRGDPNYRCRLFTNLNHTADDGSIPTEPAFPEAITQYNHGRTALLSRKLKAAECRMSTQFREVVGGDEVYGDRLQISCSNSSGEHPSWP